MALRKNSQGTAEKMGQDAPGPVAQPWDYAGWMLKSAPKTEDCDKKETFGRKLGKLCDGYDQANSLRNQLKKNSHYKRRFFVLDHHDLRYYADASQTVYKGHIDLGTVTEINESTQSDALPCAFDLITDARVFTLVPATRELLEEWKHRISQVVGRVPLRFTPVCTVVYGTALEQIEQSRRRGMIARSLRSSSVSHSKVDGRSSREVEQQLPVFPKVLSHEACRVPPYLDGADDIVVTNVKLSRLESAESAAVGVVGATSPVAAPSASRIRTASLVYTAPDANTKPRRKLTRWEEITGNCPRWHMSIMRPARLRHLPVFTPLAVALDAPPQPKSRSSSRVFRRPSLLIPETVSERPPRKSIIQSLAASMGLVSEQCIEAKADASVPDSEKPGEPAVDWRARKRPLWQQVLGRMTSPHPQQQQRPRSSSVTSLSRRNSSSSANRVFTAYSDADDVLPENPRRQSKIFHALSTKLSKTRNQFKRRRQSTGPLTPEIADHMQKMRAAMADLHESGLFVDLNEDATMYDVPEDEGGRPQVKAARPAEKYMYMAISRGERIKLMMAAVRQWNDRQDIGDAASRRQSTVDDELFRSVTESPVVAPDGDPLQRASPSAELAALQALQLSSSVLTHQPHPSQASPPEPLVITRPHALSASSTDNEGNRTPPKAPPRAPSRRTVTSAPVLSPSVTPTSAFVAPPTDVVSLTLPDPSAGPEASNPNGFTSFRRLSNRSLLQQPHSTVDPVSSSRLRAGVSLPAATGIAVEPVSIAGMRERLRSMTATALVDAMTLSHNTTAVPAIAEDEPEAEPAPDGRNSSTGTPDDPIHHPSKRDNASVDRHSGSFEGLSASRDRMSEYSDPLAAGASGQVRRVLSVGSRLPYEYSEFSSHDDGQTTVSGSRGRRGLFGDAFSVMSGSKGAGGRAAPVADEPSTPTTLHGKKRGRKYDLFEFALSQCVLRNVVTGTVLLSTEESFKTDCRACAVRVSFDSNDPTSDDVLHTCDRKQDDDDVDNSVIASCDRHMLILLHGKVSVEVSAFREDGGVVEGQAVRSPLPQSSSHPDLDALLSSVDRERRMSGSGDALSATSSRPASPATSRRSSLNNRSVAHSMGPSSSSLLSTGSDPSSPIPQSTAPVQGIWDHESVQVDAVAGPIAFGMETLLLKRRHRAQITAISPSFVLQLSLPNFRRLVRLAPSIREDMSALCYMNQPHLLLACVPCLAVALSEQSIDDLVMQTATAQATESDMMRRMLTLAKKPEGSSKRMWLLQTALASLFRVVHLQEGEVLYQSGDFGDCAYVVAHGKLSLSVRRSSDGAPVLMQSVGRGACIGESALVVPATRTVTVVALEPTLLLRLTNASLTAALGTHTKLWRDLRTAVLWREPFQLIRLPVLRSLVGTESEAYLLAPLCDMFRMTCVASIANVPVLQPNPLDAVDDKDSLRLPWCFTTSHLAGPSLNALLLVASGSVVVKLNAQDTLPLKAGEWLNGSTLMKAAPPLALAKLELSSRHTSACVFTLPEALLDRFADAIPRGHQRLKIWKMSAAQTPQQ